ncbi:hypothetical protein EON79_16315 [bacterium]|nr:MAG: hypothetical protein EON79_16315 [bacterium]
MVIGRIGRVSPFRTEAASFSPATRIAVFAPVLAVMAVGVRARYYPDSVEPWHAPKSAHTRVLAYGKVLSETDDIISQATWQIDEKRTKEAAMTWIGAAKDGTLKPLTPTFYTDTTMEGPKIEVERAVARISGSLMTFSEQAREKGNADKAVEYALMAYRMSEITRTGDLTTLATGSSRQRRAMYALAAVLPKASEKWRTEAKTVIEGNRTPIVPTVEVTLSQREDWGERYRMEPLPDATREMLVKSAMAKPEDPQASIGELKQKLSQVEDKLGAEVVFNAGRAITNEWSFEIARRKAAQTLQGS